MAISLVGSANVGMSAAALNITIPDVAGVAVDDYALVFISTNGATIADQNGWQVLKNETFPTTVAHNLVCLHKRLNSTDVSDTSFVFTASASNVMQGGIIVFRGVDLTTAIPTPWWTSADEDVTATATFNAPAVTTTQDGAMIVRGYTFFYGTGTWDGDAISAASGTEEFEIAATGALTKRPVAVYYEAQGTAGSTGTPTFTQEITGVHATFTVALRPDTGATEEGLAPTSIRNLTNLSGAVTAIDDDPDAGGTDFLTGTDPSATIGATNGPEYVDAPASSTAWTGGTAATWGTYANVIDTSESTNSTVTLTSTNTDYQNWFTFAAGDWTDLPATAVVTDVAVTVRLSIGTANRVQEHIAIASANGTLIGAEKNIADNTAAATTTLAAVTNTEFTVNAFSAMPTRADLVTGTFGVRLRQRRSNTSTITIYSIKATVTYDVPGVSTNTSVEVLMADPAATLATGAGTGEFRIQARKLGTGTNPTLRAELHENASGTILATPMPDATVSSTATTGQVLSGIFNQSVITNPANVEVWLIGTGAAGGLVEIGAVKWLASEVVSGAQSTSVTGRATGERGGDQTSAIQASQSTSATGRATGERGGDQTSAIQASQSTSLTGRATGERSGDHTSALQVSQSTSVAGRDSGERGGTHTSTVATPAQTTSVTGRATGERSGDHTSTTQANLSTSVTGRATSERGGIQTSATQASQSTSVTGRATGERSGTHTTSVGTTPQTTSVAGRDSGERGGTQSSSVQASLKTHAKREMTLADEEYLGPEYVLGGGIGYRESVSASGGAPSTSQSAAVVQKTHVKRELVLADDEYLGDDFVLGGGIGYLEPASASGAPPSSAIAAGASLTTSVPGRDTGERGGAPTSSVQASQSTSVTGRATGERSGTHSSATQASQSTSVTGRATDSQSGTHTSGVGVTPLTTTVTGRATDERTGVPGSALQAGMSTSVVGKNDSGASGQPPATVFSVPVVGYAVVAVTQEAAPVISLVQETIPTITVTQEAAVVVSITQAAETHTEIVQEDRVLVGVGQEAN